MSIFKKDDATKLQTEVDRLTRKRETLASRLVAAQSAEASARDAQRRYLVESDDADVSKGAKHAADVASASADVAAIEDAIATVDGLIKEGQTAVTAAREASARQKRAAEISKKIERLEPLAAQAEKQFESLVSVLERIAAEADDDALDLREYVELRGHGARLPVTSIIGASLAESIFRDMPDLLSVTKTPAGMFARASLNVMTRRHGGLSVDLPIDRPDGPQEFAPLKLSGALTENVIAPLKSAAAGILAGSRPITSTKTMIAEPEDDAEPVYDWTWLVFVKPARWRDWRGELIEQADSRCMVPYPVSRAAIAAGVAFPENAPEAQAHEERRYQRGFHSSTVVMSKTTAVELRVTWPTTTRAAA